MAATRLIDKAPAMTTEPKEMKVLVLGMSRTGTMSVKVALSKLGFKSYHMSEVFVNWKRSHFQYWLEALRAKYEKHGKPYGPEELKRIYADYDAITDIPSILFVDELLATYPSTKVVLTTRDPDKWLASMDHSFYTVLGWPTFALLALLDRPMMNPYRSILLIILNHWTSGSWQSRPALKQGYLANYAHVRAAVPPERLLEFEPKDGWEPLCKFLGVTTPTAAAKQGEVEPFPHVNDGTSVVELHKMLYWWRVGTVVVKTAGLMGAAVVAAWAVWWVRGT